MKKLFVTHSRGLVDRDSQIRRGRSLEQGQPGYSGEQLTEQ